MQPLSVGYESGRIYRMIKVSFCGLFLAIVSIFAVPALAVVNRLQICASQCETAFCKKLAEDVEFEFELSGNFLLPPCSKKKGTLPKHEFRLVFSESASGDHLRIELECQG